MENHYLLRRKNHYSHTTKLLRTPIKIVKEKITLQSVLNACLVQSKYARIAPYYAYFSVTYFTYIYIGDNTLYYTTPLKVR